MNNLSLPADGGRYHLSLQDTGAALENPGMGWVLHYYDNGLDAYGCRLAPSDALNDFPGITVIYLRLAWSFLEPEEGQFRWELIDTPAQRWISRGKQIAFRFTCSEWGACGTPAWVRAAGARGYTYTPGKGVDPEGEHWEPDYNDPIFLQKFENFLAIAAARYDGSPDLAFIDVGSFGVWGEMHNFWSTKLDYDAETVIRHLDLHARHFKHSLLVTNSPAADHGRSPSSIEHARNLGMSFRDDSILVLMEELTPQRWSRAASFWPHVPVILESQHYGMAVEGGYWRDGSGYLQAIEEYHASYVSIHWWPREFLAENRDLVAQIDQRMGYRLQLVEASWPQQLYPDEGWTFEARWRNVGVAPCLPGGYLTITLKDEQEGIVAVLTDDQWNVSALPVLTDGDGSMTEQSARFHVPIRLQAGTYRLYISIGSICGAPRLALPLAEHDGQRRYRLGVVTIL